jgi:hypothetical protein
MFDSTLSYSDLADQGYHINVRNYLVTAVIILRIFSIFIP